MFRCWEYALQYRLFSKEEWKAVVDAATNRTVSIDEKQDFGMHHNSSSEHISMIVNKTEEFPKKRQKQESVEG